MGPLLATLPEPSPGSLVPLSPNVGSIKVDVEVEKAWLPLALALGKMV